MVYGAVLVDNRQVLVAHGLVLAVTFETVPKAQRPIMAVLDQSRWFIEKYSNS